MADYVKFIEQQIKAGATLIIEDPEEYFGHTQASNILLLNHTLTDAEFRVYMTIRSFAYGRKLHCWPGQELIGQLVGKSRETVNRIIQKLEKKRLIHSVQRGLRKTNVYIIKKIPMYLIEEHQKLIEKTSINKPATPCKSTEVTKTSHQEKPLIHCNSSEVTKTSHQEVIKISHKEYKSNNSVVVKSKKMDIGRTAIPKQPISPSELIKTGIKLDKPNLHTSPIASKSVNQANIWNYKSIMNQIIQVTGGVNISRGFAKEIQKDYTPEQLTAALQELNCQLNNGTEIKGVGRWLRYALKNDIEPDRSVSVRTQKKAQPKQSVRNKDKPKNTDNDAKKKALIQSLYMS